MDKLDEVREVQKTIETAKYKIAKLEGEDESLLKTVKTKYKCENTSEIKAKIKKLRKRLNKKKLDAAGRLAQLNKSFQW